MASAFDFPADDLNRPDEPWFIQAKDNDPAGEFARQQAFVNFIEKHAPGVDVFAVPNASRGSDWERIRRWKEGARRGALDLVVTWQPTRPGDRGVFFPEFKDGTKGPDKDQRARLNRYFRMGHGCGVYRTKEVLLEHLRRAGAPV